MLLPVRHVSAGSWTFFQVSNFLLYGGVGLSLPNWQNGGGLAHREYTTAIFCVLVGVVACGRASTEARIASQINQLVGAATTQLHDQSQHPFCRLSLYIHSGGLRSGGTNQLY